MDRDRWQKIESVFDAALALEGGDGRARFVAAECAGDDELRLEVETLLEEAAREDDDFLTVPAFTAGLSLLARDSRDLPGGHLLGRYRILRALGRGGMGEVYLAEDTELGRRVSLKLLSSHLTGDAESVARFRREARAASGVSHPRVAHVYDFGEAEGQHYLVMEYVEGHSLRELMRHESLSLAESVALAAQVAAALAAAHGVGVVHRDIKPENIIVTDEGRAKVLDFGLAKLLEAGERAGSLLDSEAGVIMGTAAYMSPEQVRGEDVDARTDIWSLGVVLYEMIARHRPFEGRTHVDQIKAVLLTEPALPLPGVPARLNSLLSKALAKDKAGRWRRADELARELQLTAQEIASAERAESGSRPSRGRGDSPGGVGTTRRASRRALSGGLKIAAALACVVAAVAALLFFKSRRPPAAANSGRAAAASPIGSLVIVPLSTEGDEDLSYLSEGVAEDLIRSLGKLGKTRVIALSSARKLAGREADYAGVRGAVNVDFMLAGRIASRGDALSVEVYLVDLARGERVWQESYESPSREPLGVRNALFVLLSNRLQAMLAGGKQLPLPPASTTNEAAYREYLRGTYSHARHDTEGLKLSAAALERAVALDPNFALAYSSLGDSYNLLGSFLGQSPDLYLPKARAAVSKAIALDNTLAPAHTSLAKMKMDYDHDWDGAEREFRRAIELDPGDALAHHWYGEVYLSAMGRLEESIRELEIARELDPLSDGILTGLAWSHIGARDYERAVEECRQALALDPDDWSNYSYLAMAQLKLGRYDEAVDDAQRASEAEKSGGNLAALGAIYGYAGRREEAEKTLRALEARRAPHGDVSDYDLAIVYAALGRRDEALRLLNEQVSTRSVDLLSIRIDPMLDALRDDPRFPALEARYRFPPEPPKLNAAPPAP